jgi:hypothetical protein
MEQNPLHDMKQKLLQQMNDTKNDVKTYKNARSMGIGKLGEPAMTFVRQFRWVMTTSGVPEHLMNKVDFDFVSKTISLHCIEVIAPEDTDVLIDNWLEKDLTQENLVFTTYDGLGTPLYEMKFNNLTLLEDKASFDYSVSGLSIRKLKFAYDEKERVFLAKGDPRIPKKKGFSWKFRVGQDLKLFDVKSGQQPNLEIEETELNFLSSKTWIPSKAKWTDLDLIMDRKACKALMAGLLNGENEDLHLYIYDSSDRPIECWTLKSANLVKSVADDEKVPLVTETDNKKMYFVTVRYKEAFWVVQGRKE